MTHHAPGIYWISGLSGSGKTTLSVAVAEHLKARGYRCLILDGDMLRNGLCVDLGFSPADRDENIRRAGEIASLVSSQGYVCICAFITPYNAMRTRLRNKLGRIYHEIFLNCPIETCIERDPKNNYNRSINGTLHHYTGIDAPYEIPQYPDLCINTVEPLDVCVQKILNYIINIST